MLLGLGFVVRHQIGEGCPQTLRLVGVVLAPGLSVFLTPGGFRAPLRLSPGRLFVPLSLAIHVLLVASRDELVEHELDRFAGGYGAAEIPVQRASDG